MNFSSHVDAIITVAVRLVNALTPGEAHGRGYLPPDGLELAALATTALRAGRAETRELSVREASQLSDVAWLLRLVFVEAVAGHLDRAADQVNELLATTGARPVLDQHDGEPWHLHFHGDDDSLVTGWSAGCATGLAIVLGSDARGRLGICTADRCDRVFVDASKNGTRRFCSTACQNRVKAAAFRASRA